MIKNHLKKILVVSIVVLFIGIGIHPAFAKHPMGSTDAIKDNGNYEATDIDPKDYLFQTIIDITNNHEAWILFESMKVEGCPIRYNYDFRDLYREILFKKPLLFVSIILSRTGISHSYLNNCYRIGSDITDIIGEYRVNEIIDSTQVVNTDFFHKLNDILMEDEVLSSRISTLMEINYDFKDDIPFKNVSTICVILLILYITYSFRSIFSLILSNKVEENFLLSKFFDLWYFKNYMLAGICYFLFDFIDCDH